MQNLKIFHNMNNMQNMHNWSKQSMLGSVVRLAMFILLTAGKSSGFCIAKKTHFIACSRCMRMENKKGLLSVKIKIFFYMKSFNFHFF